MTKLPKDVITRLTDQKEDNQEGTVNFFKDKLHRYIINGYNNERQCGIKGDIEHSVGNMWSKSQVSDTKTATEALFSCSNPTILKI